MLFAVKALRKLDSYLRASAGLDFEFFKPRERDFALLRLKPSYRLTVERDDFNGAVAQISECLAALKRLRSHDSRAGRQDVAEQPRARALDKQGGTVCAICDEARRKDLIFSEEDDYFDYLPNEATVTVEPNDKAAPPEARVILAAALARGWRTPEEDGLRGGFEPDIARNRIEDWITAHPRLAAAALEDALGWLLALRARGKADELQTRTDSIDWARLRHTARAWLLEQIGVLAPEDRLTLYGSDSRPVLVEGSEDELRAVMTAIFLDEPSVEVTTAERDQFGFTDTQIGDTRDVPVFSGSPPSPHAPRGRFFRATSAARDALKGTGNITVIGVPDHMSESLLSDDEVVPITPVVIKAAALRTHFAAINRFTQAG